MQVGDIEVGAPVLHVGSVFHEEIVFPVIAAIGPGLPDPGGDGLAGQVNGSGDQRVAVQVVSPFGHIAALPLRLEAALQATALGQ